MKKLAVILLVALMAIFALSGCAKAGEKLAEKVMEKVIEEAAGDTSNFYPNKSENAWLSGR